MEKLKSRSLELAKKAYELVSELKNDPNKKEYLSLIKGLGSMVIQNGLVGTILFLEKKNETGKKVISHLKGMLKLRKIEKVVEKIQNFKDELNVSDYFYAQMVTLESVKWLRRYADILLGGEENENRI